VHRRPDVPRGLSDSRLKVVPRKRILPESANGSTLPTMVGAVIYVRVSTNLRSRRPEGASAGRRRSRPRISACPHNSARVRSAAAARDTKSSNGSTRKAKAPSLRIAASFRSCSRSAG
jgi:hypothetical protein